MNGVLIIDKRAGMTSHDVVSQMRRILGQRSIGHLGTLDPMATGILPIVVGSFTRLAQFYLSSEKTYEGVVRFGFATDTYDAEGEPTSPPQPVAFDMQALQRVAEQFRGIVEQMPPPYSAKKINGVPAYKLARKNQEVALKPVQVDIKDLQILALQVECAEFRARVGSGTYVRAIAHDMGQKLGCGAHLRSLRRTAVAEFSLSDARTLQDVAAAAAGNCATSLEEMFVHPRKLLPELPCVTADESTVARIRDGRTINLLELSRARQVKVFAGQRDLIAIATRVAGTLFHPKIVLCHS